MNNNTAAFDSKLRELEQELMPPTDQMEKHWIVFREHYLKPSHPTAYSFPGKLVLMGILSIATITGIAYFFQYHSKEKASVNGSPVADSTTAPVKNENIQQDTLPVKSVPPVPSHKTRRVAGASITKPATLPIPAKNDTLQKSPTKRVFGVSTRNSNTNRKDTLYWKPIQRVNGQAKDTFYFEPIKPITKRQKVTTKTSHPTLPTQAVPINTTPVLPMPETLKIINSKEALSPTNTPITDSTIRLIPDTSKFQSLEELLQEPYFRDKLVYIDLWGTRCGPCIEQFQYLAALKERYRNSKLVFLYLKSPYGFDDSKEWKEMVKQYHLSGMNVAMSLRFYDEGFWKKYASHYPESRWYTIPAYLIANRKGMIIDYDAPRPGNKEKLYPLLDKLLSL